VAACVRKTAMQWSFADFHLRSDVDLLLSLSFAPSVR